jgi:hypothetical protein
MGLVYLANVAALRFSRIIAARPPKPPKPQRAVAAGNAAAMNRNLPLDTCDR